MGQNTELYSVAGRRYPLGMGTMRAAEKALIVLNAVANNSTSAMQAGRGKCLNGALKTVERIGMPLKNDIKGLIVDVVTDDACAHNPSRGWMVYGTGSGRNESCQGAFPQ